MDSFLRNVSRIRQHQYQSLWLILIGLTIATDLLAADRPNILWLTSEDHGPDMGCYGDAYADTPNVDALAARGVTYQRAWSNAPVCAAARTCLIAGLDAPSLGAQHMRSFVPAPNGKPAYPALLRAAGYYCTNNSKEDYNISTPVNLWDESSKTAHWRNAPAGQPFFAIFNSIASHEHQLRIRPHMAIHDPEKFAVPPYHPDDSTVRRDWAQYYDTVTEADAAAGARLDELAAAGLTEDTIIFYYSDHGAGMPGHKRTANNRGLQIALIVYIPEKFANLRPTDYTPGGMSQRLVGFVDFAPTLLSLVGVRPPAWMPGHAFLGKYTTPAPEFMFGFRGRMDERVDFVRTVTDGRYVYIRNFRPDLPDGQHVEYQFETPSTARWYELWRQGRLTSAQSAFWEPTPAEELFDLSNDPYEIHNLATTPVFAATKGRLATALFKHLLASRDLGFLPEGELHRRVTGMSPYDWARVEGNYPLERIVPIASAATLGVVLPESVVRTQLADREPAVRYWTVLGLTQRDPKFIASLLNTVRPLLDDESPNVGILAANLLVQHGTPEDTTRALTLLGDWADPTGDHFTAVAALGVIDNLGALANRLHDRLAAFPRESVNLPNPRYRAYVGKLISHALSEHSDDARIE